ncbi:hypothetical protein ACX1DX_11305 [Tessaracoccus sp. Y36]|uniref:hypothetical protein n=1 Tax=Tessaracoccus sp. ZS01 TaxID=1906324 RepID=UPI0013013DAC|nr:hypothetical protein [Tessaracoccus sp. ZS01]
MRGSRFLESEPIDRLYEWFATETALDGSPLGWARAHGRSVRWARLHRPRLAA